MISQLHYEECGCTKCIFLRNDQIAKLEDENKVLWLRLVNANLHISALKESADELGVAIADAGYTWTPAMRKAYRKATR